MLQVTTNIPPIAVFAGHLAAGKTKLFICTLPHKPDKKIVALVNEFGEIGIDSQLVINPNEEIFETNSCGICCTPRGDLIRVVGDFRQRQDKFEDLATKTTTLDRAALTIQTFFVGEDLQSQLQLDVVVTVADAKYIWKNWESSEARKQFAVADAIWLNQTDRLTQQQLYELQKRIRAVNVLAKIYHNCNTNFAMDAILEVGAFKRQSARETDPSVLSQAACQHAQSVSAVALVESGVLEGEKFDNWICRLLQTTGLDIFWMKGILNIADEDCRFLCQSVRMLFERCRDRPWQPNETRKNELVFIGRNLDQAKLREDFRAILI